MDKEQLRNLRREQRRLQREVREDPRYRPRIADTPKNVYKRERLQIEDYTDAFDE